MTSYEHLYSQQLKKKDFLKLKDFIEEACGIKLNENKKNMVEGRLRKRIKLLGYSGYEEYLKYVFESDDTCPERVHLIDVITTNKTDFFREPNHFRLMTEQILPHLSQTQGLGAENTLNVWSSASSTGEEPYTMAMVLAEFYGTGGNFNIFATDINTSVLQIGRKAVYSEEKAEDIPKEFQRKYMMRSKNRDDRLLRFKPEIRSKVRFGRNNLKDSKYILPVKVDIAFCRNVIIYFDHETQQRVLSTICSYIKPGGFLFMGHSESIHGMTLPLRSFAPTVYVRV